MFIRSNNKNYQSGASLLEVMISLFVLGVGILGVLAMQAQALRINGQAYNYSKAVFLADDIVERMRNNLDALDTYIVDKIDSGDKGTGGTACYGGAAKTSCGVGVAGAKELAQADIEQWATSLTNSLPNAEATISEVGDIGDGAAVKDGNLSNGRTIYSKKIIKVDITFSTVELDGVTINADENKRETYTLVTGV